ncbi:hypothetical protein GCM10027047_17530 [Rhodococcus aerolatus]
MTPTPEDRVPAVVRGGGVGGLAAALAVAAHALSGGAVPAGPGLLVVALLGVVLGGAAVVVPGLRRGPAGLVGVLALAQLGGHLLLHGLTHPATASATTPGMAGMAGTAHAATPVTDLPMLAGHTLAALVCALLVVRAEDRTRVARRLAAALPALAPVLLAPPRPAAARPSLPVLDHHGPAVPPAACPVRGTGLRGPPRPATTAP